MLSFLRGKRALGYAGAFGGKAGLNEALDGGRVCWAGLELLELDVDGLDGEGGLDGVRGKLGGCLDFCGVEEAGAMRPIVRD
jgi:hypothetical protein